MSPGSRVAVHDEMNAYLPRVAEQLRDCAEHVTTGSAYKQKWLVEGVRTSAGDAAANGIDGVERRAFQRLLVPA